MNWISGNEFTMKLRAGSFELEILQQALWLDSATLVGDLHALKWRNQISP
jgi:hypothetical protein